MENSKKTTSISNYEMKYEIVIEPRALLDIQNAIDYYDSKKIGLGEYFLESIDEHFKTLEKNPVFQFRYKEYQALPVKKFPFLILFFVNEEFKKVYIMSVFNTNQDTKKYPK